MKNHKVEVILNDDEIDIVCDIQKKIIEIIAEKTLKLSGADKQFHVMTLTLAISISNLLTSFGIIDISGTELFMNDLKDLIFKIHKSLRENSSFMEFKNGVKIREGKFN